MSLTVLPMSEADMPAMTQLLHNAYYSSTGAGISGLLYHTPPSPTSLDKTTAQRLRAHRDPESVAHFVKVVDVATNNLVACARWDIFRHGRSAAAVARAAAIDPAEDLISEFNADVYAALFGPLRAARAEIVGERPHAHLVSLVTDPEHGGRDAGGMLVRWGLERADELGLDAYLDASPMGRGLYEKCGFEVVRDFRFDLAVFGGKGEVLHVCMWRRLGPPPRKIVAA